jgi:hypothetical protein
MQRLYVPSLVPTDWRRLLANPYTQWQRHKSAHEMAVCWESSRMSDRGLPPELAETIDSYPALAGAHFLIGIPEYQVAFQGGGHPSQNDLWALLGAVDQTVSVAIEAKGGEKFGEPVEKWISTDNERSRKPERLEDLRRWLGIPTEDVSKIRYQLLHRTGSALKDAQRFRASWAVLLIQSFNRQADQESFEDFAEFSNLMLVTVSEGRLAKSAQPTAVPLLLGWVSCTPAGLDRLNAAVYSATRCAALNDMLVTCKERVAVESIR